VKILKFEFQNELVVLKNISFIADPEIKTPTVMKKTTKMLLLCLGLLIIQPALGQDTFEGTVNYEIDYIELPKEAQAYRNMMPNSMMISLKGGKSRIEQSMGDGNKQVIITDMEEKIGYVAMNMMGQKMLITIPKDKLESSMEENKDVKIEYLDETKRIAGYDCKKAVLNQNNSTMTVYYTEALPSRAHKDFSSLKGLPLEYETTQNGIHMRISATDVAKKSMGANLFNKPTGYHEISFDQMMQMSGGKFKF